MKDSLIEDPSRGFIMGFSTFALAMFLGYKWSSDYMEMVSNGYNFLWIFGFGMILFVATWLIDGYFKTKGDKK